MTIPLGSRHSGPRLSANLLVLVVLMGTVLPASTQESAPRDFLSAVVGVDAKVPSSARTARALGTERTGSGVLIDGNGLVLTIGYLILEASEIELTPARGPRVPAEVLAYDHGTGFGLLRAMGSLELEPMSLGESATLAEGDRVLVASRGGLGETRPAIVVSRRVFAGYWEYLLERAIFTSPPHPRFGGAALVGADGRLLGIGSLVVPDAGGKEPTVPGNLFVPVDRVKPILGDLLTIGRSSAAPRPWVGVYLEEVRDYLFVNSVADDGPAARAGIETGNVILAVGSEPVNSMETFYRKVWALGDAGVKIPLTVLRGAGTQQVTVETADRYTWLRLNPAL